jgi:hypothetical protein
MMSRKSITLHTKRKTANIRKQTQEGKSDYENQKAGRIFTAENREHTLSSALWAENSRPAARNGAE